MADEPNVIGEVIEASTTEFAAESRELHAPPPFGSFVKVPWDGEGDVSEKTSVSSHAASAEDELDPFREKEGSFGSDYRKTVEGEAIEPVPGLQPAIYGVLHQATTSPVDSGRRLRAYWKDEEQLKQEQPELSEWLLVTEFRATIVGYSANGLTHQILPPRPPNLHLPVHPCTNDEIVLITSRMNFLRTLATSRDAPTDEVVAACIRQADVARGGDFEFLVAAGKELASLLKDDYDRLQAIMRRVTP